MTEIKELLSDKDDDEIMKMLGIPNATYYRYKSQIYQEDRELWNQIAKESLESRARKDNEKFRAMYCRKYRDSYRQRARC